MSMYRARYLMGTLILFASLQLSASGAEMNLYFKNLDMKDGLSDNTIFTILQDEQGFMWFGTKNGLNRYDGHTFRIFNTESENSLESNMIYALCEDGRGTLWVGTGSGVYAYDANRESFTLFGLVSDKSSKIIGSVSMIERDLQGNIWMVVDNRDLFKYDLHKQELKQYGHEPNQTGSLSPGHISTVMVDGSGDVWVGVIGHGVHKFIQETESFREYLDED